jgi:hypothetical protein
MDTMLIFVAGISLTLATGMAIVAWKLLRDSQRLSAARADALAALADSDEVFDDAEPETEPDLPAFAADGIGAEGDAPPGNSPHVYNAPPAAAQTVESSTGEPGREGWSDRDLALGPSIEDLPMFGSTDPVRTGRRWVAIAAALAVIAGTAGATVIFRSTGIFSAVGAAAMSDTGTTPVVQPIELLSLNHTVDVDGSFIVTGLVRGPAATKTPTGLVAVVYLFDQKGRYFATGQAELERGWLAPGEQSGFVVRVATPSAVGRYRLGFRADGTGVMPHVDRRESASAPLPPAGSGGPANVPGDGKTPARPVIRPRNSRVRT